MQAGFKEEMGKMNANPDKQNEFLRAENEDDDGYDPYSDRPAQQEDMFEEDPWR